ncbi:MAG: creatininase family protein [Verrucomicrobiia bacterium]
MNSPSPEVRFEMMRPHQVRECREKADVAFLPLGPLEWHGVQNPLGVDPVKMHHICCIAARKLGGGAVFPSLIWGIPRDSFMVGGGAQRPPMEGDPIARALGPLADMESAAKVLGIPVEVVRGFSPHGGMDIQEQWLFYQRLVRMSLETIAGFGFRSIYLCSGHAPLVHWSRPVAIAFTRATMMARRVVTTDWGGEGDAAGLRVDHGGKWETSLMMALEPTSVDLAEIARPPGFRGVGCNPNAVESTCEQGAEWTQACASAISAEAQWLVEHYPELPPRHHHTR